MTFSKNVFLKSQFSFLSHLRSLGFYKCTFNLQITREYKLNLKPIAQ